METMDSSDHSNNSSMVTSSTDSDTNSVLSVIFNQTESEEQNDRLGVLSYGTPLRPLFLGSNVIASCVYVLIDERRSMSADMRVMWYLKRLGTVQTVESNLEPPEQCKIMSFIPRENNLDQNNHDSSLFVMDALTRVYFLTAVYNMVYCLDMSPSNISVDLQRNHVMLDEMIIALKRSIEGFIRPFIVPGSNQILFQPQVYVTVIVHTPFYTSLAQQVLVQGWLINNNNFNEFIQMVTSEMNRLENALAKTKIIQNTEVFDDLSEDGAHNKEDQQLIDDAQSITDKSVYDNVTNSGEGLSSVSKNSPDSGFINTLRYGMLAVRLLPRSSISNLIVITDGMITLADIQVLDSVLNQLRCIGVACSFMHVSSQFHPNSGHGHVPYSELMQLIATATSGTYFNSFPKTTHNFAVNYYHDKFIMWSFKRGDGNESPNNTTNLSCTPPRLRPGEWTVRNSNFYGNRETQLVSKKQISDHVQAQLENIVCCRMREGFLIEDIQLKYVENSSTVPNINDSSILQLKFILPWTNHIYIEYDLIMKWPPQVKKNESKVVEVKPKVQVPSARTAQSTQVPEPPQPESGLNIHYTVSVKGPYEFLHDITCGRYKKSNQMLKLSQQCQFQLSSCQSSLISIATATSSVTNKPHLVRDRLSISTQKTVSSKYRQALIARFWLTMRSIAQTDLLVKHLETYSLSTGHLLVDYMLCSQSEKENENLQTTQIQQTDDSSIKSSHLTNINLTTVNNTLVNAATKTESKSVKSSASEVPIRSPLRSGMPLFYHLPTNSNTAFSVKQTHGKLNDQQQSYTDQQYQQFADFWKPICTLDPDSQWPKWFSTYRIGGGVLLLRHDRPLPRWLHMANTINGRYQTLTCRKSAESLFDLLKQWCTFVMLDEHSYVKCLDQSDTLTDNVSFCIAQISLRSPSCCCVVLHLAFQSCIPASVHHKIIDELKNDIELLDSTTAVKRLTFIENKQLLPTNKKKKKKKRKESEQSLTKKKSTRPQKYVYFLDKPLEKILIRYERIPSQFTTVIFPDGSQPCPAVKTSTIQNPKYSKSSIGKEDSYESTGVELKAVTATTTLSRYLYHRRWIWSSGSFTYRKCSSSASHKLQLQLAHTLSMLTKIRLREGFRFAHSSTGIINMVLQVDMIEGSQYCPSTPTSQCVIQYVLFPPNLLHNHQQKENDYASIVDIIKKKTNDDEKSSTSSVEDQQQFDKGQKQEINLITLDDCDNCCSQCNTIEDDYQLITECWIEPQHGSVVPHKSLSNNYMSGLMYKELADAMWRVDSDCIGSLYTFQHMQYMCADPNILTLNLDINSDKNQQQNKTTIIDDGRIYKLPFTFSLINLLPKCRYHSSITFDLFTNTCDDDTHADTDLCSVQDAKKVNHMLERSFYSRLRSINNRSFNVDGSVTSENSNEKATKVNDKEIGQCFVKRVNDSRLILTVAPPFIEEKQHNVVESISQDNLQPFGRSRANTWHYTKRNTDEASLSAQPKDDSMHYYRTMSVGSYPYYKGSDDLSWAQLRFEQNVCASETQDTQQCGTDNIQQDEQDFPTNVFVEVYDCRQEDVENFLMSDSNSFDHTLINDLVNEYTEDSNSDSSTATNGEEDDEGKLLITRRKKLVFEEPDPLLLDKYLQKIQVVYDRSLVTTVFHALHLGLNVRCLDVQRAVDKCQHRLITFDITDYIKVVCDHFKKNTYNCSVCPADNKTLKSHHDMIHSTFSSTLDRHMLKSVTSHPNYYFYDFIDNLDCDDNPKENFYPSTRLSSNSDKKTYFSNNLIEQNLSSTNIDVQELDEQDLFPLFVHLVCTVKTSKMTKNQSVHSLPTCILELISEGNDIDMEFARNLNFNDLKVSLDVYCLMLPNNDYDDDDDDGEDDNNRFINTMNSSEQLNFPNFSNSTILHSTKQNGDYENPFLYLSSSLPPRHAQGLAAFIAEVEWCMHDEMATGLLNDPIVTSNTLEKVIEHVSNSPNSSSNIHEQIPVHFVVPSSIPMKYNSVSLFLQKLNKLDLILDNENEDGLYTLEKSTNDTYYVVKKQMHLNPCNTATNSINNEDTDVNCDSEDDTEYSFLVLPNFWIILKIQADQLYLKDKSDNNNTINTLIINVYFHCRFTELDVHGKYSALREIVEQNVRHAATIVNQTLLLCRLHDTRTCDPLLEPIIEDVINSDDDDKNGNGEIERVTKIFTLGQFKCPVVWSTRFHLHPRLRHITSMVVFGVQVLHNVLEKLSVRNRRNMFVYKESTGSVFYLRLYESLSQHHQKNSTAEYNSDDEDSISRCSSATSTTATISSTVFPSNYSNFSRKYSEDLNYTMENRSIQTPGTRSLNSYGGDTDSKDVEELILKVHGISPVGNEIRIDLVEVLQNRLNDALLEVLTSVLLRNPVCKLYPDDVRYIQPYDDRADNSMTLSLPIETKITKHFVRNLKRNAATLFLFPPKYASRHHKFNYIYDASDNFEKPIIHSFFLLNQQRADGTSTIRVTNGNRGLACILYDIYSNEVNNSIDNLYDYPTDPELFEKHILATCIEDDLSSISEYSGYVKVFMWRRGRINIEALRIKLTSIIMYSMWDIYIERFLWEHPIIIEQSSKVYVNPLCFQYLAKWIAFGARISAPLARHSHMQCRIHVNHVLREFKAHLSWFKTSASKSLPISIHYFYIPRMDYGRSEADCVNSNIISGSTDPLQLGKKQDDSLINNLMFNEWQISSSDSVICPPSAICVLIIVTVTSIKKTKHKCKQNQTQNKDSHSESDTDNGFVVPEDEENTNNEEDQTITLSNNDQSVSSNNNSFDSVKQNSITSIKKYQKQENINTNKNKISKYLMLTVTGQSVHTLSYNCLNDDQSIAILRLSRWLEWRHSVFTTSIYDMMGLKNTIIASQLGNTHSPRINNNIDLLLDYKSYSTVADERESYDRVTFEKHSKLSKRNKQLDDSDDKKNKSLQHNKDVHDFYIEQLVRRNKQQRRLDLNKKILHDLWIQGDAIVTKEVFRVFYNHSRLIHYCLTPLLFLPRWRVDLSATRTHLVDAVKTKHLSSIPPPRWHKRLCARLANAYAHYVETDPLFNGFQPIQINKLRTFNDSVSMELDYAKPTTCYYKKTVPGATGGLLLMETGISQPFYYVKLSSVEIDRFANQVEYFEDDNKSLFALLDYSDHIIQNMHLHSFTYDFHIRVLSDRLNKLVQKQKEGKRNNYGHDLSSLLEHKNSASSSTTKSGCGSQKNAVAGFLDDFLEYYKLPPLYSSCLVLAGVIKRTQIPVTGLQLYEYLLDNCSEDCDGMAVIQICDSSLIDGDDGAPLFDDNEDYENCEFLDNQNSLGNDLTDFVLVHHMAGSDIQRRQELEMNSKGRKSALESNNLYNDCEFEVCGLYDATLVMTLSSEKEILLDTNNEITLSYYVLLTNNENDILEKKEMALHKTNYIKQQRHSTPIRPSDHRFDQTNNILSSSVPSSSFGNTVITELTTCWGSLDKNNTNNNQSQFSTIDSPQLKRRNKKNSNRVNDDLNNHHQLVIKKRNLIKFYEKKAAELVADTVDTAANRCRMHLLWQIFSAPIEQQKVGFTGVTFNELRELVNKSGLVQPLSEYDKNLGPLINELLKGPQWFIGLHKLIMAPMSILASTTTSARCRIFSSTKPEHQYLVVLPDRSDDEEYNTFIIINNGVDSTDNIVTSSDSLINIVFRRNKGSSEEINNLVETVGKAICYYIWRTVATSHVSRHRLYPG